MGGGESEVLSLTLMGILHKANPSGSAFSTARP
jgi:hypothetical protein